MSACPGSLMRGCITDVFGSAAPGPKIRGPSKRLDAAQPADRQGTTRRRLVDPNIVSWNLGHAVRTSSDEHRPHCLTAPSMAQATISHTIGVATLVALRAQLAKRHENPCQNGDGGAVRSTNQVEATDWLIRLLAHQKRAVSLR
jgi:hypothetical protein